MAEDWYKYADIIDVEHPDPQTHPRMSVMARAAQFASFAALTGYEEMVDDTTRISEEKWVEKVDEECPWGL